MYSVNWCFIPDPQIWGNFEKWIYYMYVYTFCGMHSKMIKPLLTIPLGSMYLNHSCTYKQILALKVILKSLSNWYLAQAGERQIILNFLIVLGQK